MTSFGPIRLLNAILCDDVRQEANNNKYIIIGTYSGDLVLGAEFPTVIQLSLYLEVFVPAGVHDLEFRFSGPGRGSAIIRAQLEHSEAGPGTVTLARANIAMEKAGVFRLDARVLNGKWTNVFKKQVSYDPSIAPQRRAAQSPLDVLDSSSQP